MKTVPAIFALTLLALPASARAEDPHAMHDIEASSAATGEAAKAYEEVNLKMHKDMAIEFSGNPDVDFARGMVPHHQGAIDMAKVVLKYGKDPELRKLAEEIIKAQDTEIGFMKSWLAKQQK